MGLLRPPIYHPARLMAGITYSPKAQRGSLYSIERELTLPSPNKVVIKAYVTPEEYEEVIKHSDQAQISISKFVRLMCLGYEPKSKIDHEAILALLKVNRDLSRLGNLFKLAVDNNAIGEDKILEHLDSIKKMKNILLEKVKVI